MIISGNNIGIDFQTSNFDAFDKDFAQLESDGLRVSSDLPGLGIIEGMLPISALPEAAKHVCIGQRDADVAIEWRDRDRLNACNGPDRPLAQGVGRTFSLRPDRDQGR